MRKGSSCSMADTVAKNKLIYIFVFFKFIYVISGFSQNTFNVKVVDLLGRPASGVIVTFEDPQNNRCGFGFTDTLGRVSLDVHQIPNFVFAYDARSNPNYGFTSLLINQSRHEYQMIIPFRPINQTNVARQLENIYENIRTFHGYYSTFDFIEKTSRGAKSIGYGVPEIFSISPLPKFEEGKAYLEVSGLLADFIFGFYQNMMSSVGQLMGNDAVFQYQRYPQAY